MGGGGGALTGYVSKILYVNAKESGPLGGSADLGFLKFFWQIRLICLISLNTGT